MKEVARWIFVAIPFLLCAALATADPFLSPGSNADAACHLDIEASTTSPVISQQPFNNLFIYYFSEPNCPGYPQTPSAATVRRLSVVTISAPLTLSCNPGEIYNYFQALHKTHSPDPADIRSIWVAAVYSSLSPHVNGYVWRAQTPVSSDYAFGGCFNVDCSQGNECKLVDPAQVQVMNMIPPTQPT